MAGSILVWDHDSSTGRPNEANAKVCMYLSDLLARTVRVNEKGELQGTPLNTLNSDGVVQSEGLKLEQKHLLYSEQVQVAVFTKAADSKISSDRQKMLVVFAGSGVSGGSWQPSHRDLSLIRSDQHTPKHTDAAGGVHGNYRLGLDSKGTGGEAVDVNIWTCLKEILQKFAMETTRKANAPGYTGYDDLELILTGWCEGAGLAMLVLARLMFLAKPFSSHFKVFDHGLASRNIVPDGVYLFAPPPVIAADAFAVLKDLVGSRVFNILFENDVASGLMMLEGLPRRLYHLLGSRTLIKNLPPVKTLSIQAQPSTTTDSVETQLSSAECLNMLNTRLAGAEFEPYNIFMAPQLAHYSLPRNVIYSIFDLVFTLVGAYLFYQMGVFGKVSPAVIDDLVIMGSVLGFASRARIVDYVGMAIGKVKDESVISELLKAGRDVGGASMAALVAKSGADIAGSPEAGTPERALILFAAVFGLSEIFKRLIVANYKIAEKNEAAEKEAAGDDGKLKLKVT